MGLQETIRMMPYPYDYYSDYHNLRLVDAFMASLDRSVEEDRKRRLQEKRDRVTPWRSTSSKRKNRG
jgi:hypothetical protein